MGIAHKNIVICPACGAENIEGADICGNCLVDLRTLDVPETAQVASESDLTKPISSLRLGRPNVIRATATVREAIDCMQGDSSGAVVVLEGDRIAGIFTERDVLKKVAGRPETFHESVAAFMTPDPVVLRDSDMMAYALNKMGDGGFRHIPVTRNGELAALVTGRDVMNWVLGRYFDGEPNG